MKRLFSMAMTGILVLSLLPTTAFGANENVKATAKIVGAENYTVSEIQGTNGVISADEAAELQLTFTTADYASTKVPEAEITLTLDKAEFLDRNGDKVGSQTTVENLVGLIGLRADSAQYILTAGEAGTEQEGQYVFINRQGDILTDSIGTTVEVTALEVDDTDDITVTLKGQMKRGWVFSYNLTSKLTKTSKNTQAAVTVESRDMTITGGDDLVYAAVAAKGIQVSVKKLKDVAVEEVVTISDLKLEPSVGANMSAVLSEGNTITLKLNSGFEFANSNSRAITVKAGNTETTPEITYDDDEMVIKVNAAMASADVEELTIGAVQVEATTAKEGATATIRVLATGNDTVSVEVAKVVAYAVQMSVDEEEDIPVMYSGVDTENTGITDDSDHESLEVTIKETFAGAWDNSKAFILRLPEGVYAAEVAVNGDPLEEADFLEAYEDGEYEAFSFGKRIFAESKIGDDPYEMTVTFTLVADPDFEGDVELTLEGAALETQEVTIAKFVKPFTVTAEQNDLAIDYRNTEIPTNIVITEAEAGLWDKGSKFALCLDKIDFDDDAVITANKDSGLTVKNVKTSNGEITFTVDSRSDEEPAEVTISNLTLYMDRNLPAGAYDLSVYGLTMLGVSTADDAENFRASRYSAGADGYLVQTLYADDTVFVGEKAEDISYVAKTGFVHIITGGRDVDGFTTKLIVPIGEAYLIAGEKNIELDVPAYINSNGYTMLPIRAVATALGTDNSNVLWDQASRTVTILYGSRIISMTAGASVMYVNGSAIPTSATLELTGDRAFLPMRDLATALGVTDLTWDSDSNTGKTTVVYMNANA